MAITDEDRINMLGGMARKAAITKKNRDKQLNAATGDGEEGETASEVAKPATMSQADFSFGRKKPDPEGLVAALRKRK